MPNKKGGKKFKRGKKMTQHYNKLILKDPKEDQEYAQIKQVLGNGRYKMFCFDGKERMGISAGNIRRKTRIILNDIVLTAKWEFQTNDDKCSIVHKYEEDDVQKLIKQDEFPKNINLNGDNSFSDDVQFSFDMPSDDEEEKNEEKSSSESEEEEDFFVDVNDI